MNELNNVRFVEDNGKWVWKCYDANGSVTHRSSLFETEKEAREDYEVNGGQYKNPSSPSEAQTQSTTDTSPESEAQKEVSAGSTAPEGEIGAGTTSPDDLEDSLVS